MVKKIEMKEKFLENFIPSFGKACRAAVSYTHLDVYKRQGIVWGKYLALVTVYAIPLAIVGICPLVMRAYGSVSLARSCLLYTSRCV